MSIAYLTAYNTEITTLLSQIDAENELIQSGKSTAYDNMPLYLKKLLTAVENAKTEFITTYLTTDQKAMYENGNLTLDEIVKHDLSFFYNTLQKLGTYALCTLGNITSYPKQGTISFYANADEYTLTTSQFTENDSNKVIDDSTYEYYTVQSGDTSRIIAKRMTGDSEKYITILKINQLSESDFIDETIVGKQIKVPMESESISRTVDNLVFEPNTDDTASFIHGSDLLSGINTTLEISPTGDLSGVSGVDNTLQSIDARLKTQKGTLNVFTENFGLTSLGDGNQPILVRVERYLTDFIQQIQEDPRVESAQLDMSSISLEGEALHAKAKVTLLGSNQTHEVSL